MSIFMLCRALIPLQTIPQDQDTYLDLSGVHVQSLNRPQHFIPWDHPFSLMGHTQTFPHYTNHWAYNNGSFIPMDEWTFTIGIIFAFRGINSHPSWITGISCFRLGISASTTYSNINIVIKALSQNFSLSATVVTALHGKQPPLPLTCLA
jgi:hypothetical protein